MQLSIYNRNCTYGYGCVFIGSSYNILMIGFHINIFLLKMFTFIGDTSKFQLKFYPKYNWTSRQYQFQNF